MQLHAHVMHSVVATGRKGNPMSVTVCVESQPPKELCIYGVFDISGSMGQGSRSAFETMKQAVLDFVPALAKLRLPCQFGALAFNHEVKVLVPLTSLTSCDKVVELCNEALTEPGGNTDVGKALCAAFEQMHINLKRKRDAKDIHVFVLTDGQDPHLSQKLRHNERRLALFEMENTTVHMVSVGHDISKDLNSLVVKAAKRGTDNLINLPEQIPLVLDNFLDYMQHNVAANLLLRVRCGGEVVVAPTQLQLKEGVQKTVPLLLPARAGRFEVEVLDSQGTVLASHACEVKEGNVWSEVNPLCVEGELSRRYTEALYDAGELVRQHRRRQALDVLRGVLVEVRSLYPDQTSQASAARPASMVKLEQAHDTLAAEVLAMQDGQDVSDLTSARMMSAACTERNDSLTHGFDSVGF